jgi:hypothetical protein
MRRVFLILLVLMLPWRLWAADMMSLTALTDAAGGHAACHQLAADLAVPAGEVSGPAVEAPTSLHLAAGTTPADTLDCSTGHGHCLLCGVCHQTLGAPTTLGALPQGLPAGPPVPVTATAREAEPQRAVEPPRG